jgi:hypothetical protein
MAAGGFMTGRYLLATPRACKLIVLMLTVIMFLATVDLSMQ